jgi:monoamine oxidase
MFPRPFDPWFNKDSFVFDSQTVAERVESLALSPQARIIIDAQLACAYQAPAEEVSLAHSLHYWTLNWWNAQIQLEASSAFGIVGGINRLTDAIAADTTATIKTGIKVVSIASSGDGVTVTTSTGETFTASAAIVTTPLNALGDITFQPPLSEGKRQAIAEGTASQGAKYWVRVKGEVQPFVSFASPKDSPLSIADSHSSVDGDSILVVFTHDVTLVPFGDNAAMQAALRLWMPDVEVLEIGGHDWVHDEFSKETWPNLRPGQMTGGLPALQEPEGRIFLAGADYASGWYGHIDGAIESAIVTSRLVRVSAWKADS